MQGVPVAPTATAPTPAPKTPTLPLVTVRYTMTDDNPKNEETYIFRATFSKKEASEKDVYDAIAKKIEEKILDPQGLGFEEQEENEDYFVLDAKDELDVPVIIHLKYNDENDKTQEKTFNSLDEFDKEYGFQLWQTQQTKTSSSSNSSNVIQGNLVSTLPTNGGPNRWANLPDLHLPIYNDGRVGIPSGVVKDLSKDAIVLRVGDVPNTVKFICLQDYLSSQD
jgi:hypothetical protein